MNSIKESNKSTAIVFPGILLMLSLFISPMAAFGAPAADSQASAKTQSVLDYITNLPTLSSNRVVSGQHTFMTDNLIQSIYNATGKNVGLVGVDYFYENNSSTNNQIIAWANANSLITIVDHLNNPKTGGNAWDTNFTDADLVSMITNGTALNNTFKGVLDSIAAGLSTLQNSNVVVLFRPFHEMNGSWFWWGGKSTTNFQNLWIYTFNYLTNTKGLHNLLWVWSTYGTLDWSYYPGQQYVDIVGADIYGAPTVPQISGYGSLTTYNKPFAITEYGPCDVNAGCTSPVDVSPLIGSIKTNMPKTTYWMNWAQTWSLYYNTGTSTLFADPWVVTRDDIVLSGAKPPAPSGLKILTVQ
jgi:mannan endo-1,4-beta-mannosidase